MSKTDRKEFLARTVRKYPGLVAEIYSFPEWIGPEDFEGAAGLAENWRSRGVYSLDGNNRERFMAPPEATRVELFECTRGRGADFYEDSLQASVYDGDGGIVAVSLGGTTITHRRDKCNKNQERRRQTRRQHDNDDVQSENHVRGAVGPLQLQRRGRKR